MGSIEGNDFKMMDLPITSAQHNLDGDVLDLLECSDDSYSELLPGESIILFFRGIQYNPKHIGFIIVSEGGYFTLEG